MLLPPVPRFDDLQLSSASPTPSAPWRTGAVQGLARLQPGRLDRPCRCEPRPLCAIPTDMDGKPLPRFRRAIPDIVDEAVVDVLAHGAGHPRAAFEGEGDELACHVRTRYGSTHESGEASRSNVAPFLHRGLCHGGRDECPVAPSTQDPSRSPSCRQGRRPSTFRNVGGMIASLSAATCCRHCRSRLRSLVLGPVCC